MALEQLCGYIIRGMSYPYGVFNDEVIETMKFASMEYARTVQSTSRFEMPQDFMKWQPTCHHKDKLIERANQFLNYKPCGIVDALFNVWGHSKDFFIDNNWPLIEEFCDLMSNQDDIWYATNIEIFDYVAAIKSLKYSQDLKMVYNPTATDVFISANGQSVEVNAGQTVKI